MKAKICLLVMFHTLKSVLIKKKTRSPNKNNSYNKTIELRKGAERERDSMIRIGSC